MILRPDVRASSLSSLSRGLQSPQSLRRCFCTERWMKWEKTGEMFTCREIVAVMSNWPEGKVNWNFLNGVMI